MYIYPTDTEGFDAKVYLWVRKSEFKNGLDLILFETIKKWMKDKWPFKKIEYPGRN